MSSSIEKLPTPLVMSQYPAVDRGFKGGGRVMVAVERAKKKRGRRRRSRRREKYLVTKRALARREDRGRKG